MTRTTRLAFTNRVVRVTLRGKRDAVHQRGYIRVDGVTVSGYVFDGQAEQVFYPEGVNRDVAYRSGEVTAFSKAA